jgi:hypothetical protein
MGSKAAITVNRPQDEVRANWQGADYEATFKDAPGDRGTEIHLDFEKGKERAKAMDELRRFKQQIETGEITRSDATPGGERFQRKLKQRPAQPLEPSELEKAGV